jgi:lipoprotein-anchoring transpeptidase ErfK/SrfK
MDYGDEKLSRFLWLALVAIAAALALPARANTWPLPPPGSRLVGQNQFHVVENNGGSLEAIAKKYNVGFLALLQANPGGPLCSARRQRADHSAADAAARCAARRAGD